MSRRSQSRFHTCFRAYLLMGSFLFANAQIKHPYIPPPPLEESNFAQPPSDAHTHFNNAILHRFSVQCWLSSPFPSGGEHGFQKVSAWIPLDNSLYSGPKDNSLFKQTDISSFQGGGATSPLKPDDVPSGLFIAFKGHPVYKVMEIRYIPSTKAEPPSAVSTQSGIAIDVLFEHEPSMGECYLDTAIWVAVGR